MRDCVEAQSFFLLSGECDSFLKVKRKC
jgi:hypothetical protein